MNKAYINGIGAVTPQGLCTRGALLPGVFEYHEKMLQIQKPDYKKYMEAKSLRRMSKIVRMGVYAAFDAMNDAGIEQPGAILTGTGMGCQKDTEKFLNGMIDNNETFGNPTAFMQSTHNTVGARIALMLKNQNENFTYVHRTFSFESALLDSMLMLADGKQNLLLGGIDEITEESRLIKTHIHHYKSGPVNNLQLFNDHQPGALPGEGAAFFVLSKSKNEKSYAAVQDVKNFFRPESMDEVVEKLNTFLAKNNLTAGSIDLLLMGYNGDKKFDSTYQNLEDLLFSHTATARFKHLSGEYDTASAFAMALAAKIISGEPVPEIIMKKGKARQKPRKVLIYNQFRNINHSFLLLTDG